MIQATKKSATGFLNILKDSNTGYSLGGDNFHGVRKGSLIQLEGDPSFVAISNNTRKDFCFKFEKVEDKKLLIKQDIQAKLAVGDFVSIKIPRFEALGLSGLIERGKGYNVGDIVQISEGNPTLDVVTNKLNDTSLEVISVDENGAIIKLRLKSKGEYYEPPQEECWLEGGEGQGARISLDFQESIEKKKVEKQIVKIERSPSFTFITLDTNFSFEIEKSELEFGKWEVTLSSNHFQQDGVYGYSLLSKFTPNLNFPLLPENALDPISIYNRTILQLDKQIYDLKQQIDWLKSKI
jgi:hypothetical protein|tara:strand:+ start:91 stop:975 length:885 start_codon:yes stop_codon:yes gene_type:complete